MAALWTQAGGQASHTIEAVAVALAESSGDPNAIGPTDDWGLWQINGVHAAFFGSQWVNRLDPAENARMAVSVSAAGTNWAPWSTAYANINASGWSSYLSGLEPGSPASHYVSIVAAALAIGGGGSSVCGPDDIGIPNAVVAGLQPGQTVQTVTCPGGDFDAGDLMPGLQVCWEYDGVGLTQQTECVTSASVGAIVPRNTAVRITRLGSATPPPAQPPPTYQPPPPPGPPQPSPVPPISPFPPPTAPLGTGRQQLQTAWGAQWTWYNIFAPAHVSRILLARQHLRGWLQ